MKRKLLPLFLLSSSIAAAQQPNIVMLFVDDLGWSDLGYQNSEFETPNIDKLKHDGLYFSRTYVSTATSSPSRASLLTGKEALRCGFVRHIYDNQLFYRTYFKLGYDNNYKIITYDTDLAKKHFQNKFIEYHMEFFKAGITRIIKLWLQNGCKETPEDMFEIIKSEYSGRI